jgi:DNA helicase II / ATP-dependent DNA helicase PcrA
MLISTAEQLAVKHAATDRHIRVLAGPGTGKSTTMVQRIGYLVNELNMDPKRILTLMFNKGAQLSFKERLLEVIPEDSVNVVTYNAFGFRILMELEKAGICEPYQFKAHDYEQSALIQEVLLKYVDSKAAKDQFKSFADFLTLVKSSTASAQDMFKRHIKQAELIHFVDAFYQYENIRHLSKVRFFADQIYDAVAVLERHPDAVNMFNHRYDQIIIDEFQDINESSLRLVELISGHNTKLTVIADDDQTINEWRGSRPDFLIHEFEKRYKPCSTFHLSQTHRYGHFIALASNNVIRHNKNRIEKGCVSAHGTPRTNIELYPELQSGRTLSSIVTNLLKTKKPSDIAILVRVFSLTPALEIDLLASGIPYELVGAKPISNNPTIQCMTDILQIHYLAHTSPESITLAMVKSAMSEPRPLVKASVMEVIYQATLDALVNQSEQPEDCIYNAIPSALHNYSAKKLKEHIDRLICVVKAKASHTPKQLLDDFINNKTMLESYKVTHSDEDAENKTQLITSFCTYMSRFKTSIEAINAFKNLLEARHTSGTEQCIHITSVHQSKGRDWPIVIMPGLSDGIFPYQYMESTNLESERRLFFVGMTRAKERLVLISPYDPKLFGEKPSGNQTIGKASPFLFEAELQTSNLVTAKLLGKYPNAINLDKNKHSYNQYLTTIKADFRV